jgi:hypothetical protein
MSYYAWKRIGLVILLSSVLSLAVSYSVYKYRNNPDLSRGKIFASQSRTAITPLNVFTSDASIDARTGVVTQVTHTDYLAAIGNIFLLSMPITAILVLSKKLRPR